LKKLIVKNADVITITNYNTFKNVCFKLESVEWEVCLEFETVEWEMCLDFDLFQFEKFDSTSTKLSKSHLRVRSSVEL
jgi:hypothetical protein